jgi:hypothetical protein
MGTYDACDTRYAAYACGEFLSGRERLTDDEDFCGLALCERKGGDGVLAVYVEVEFPGIRGVDVLGSHVVLDAQEEVVDLVDKDGWVENRQHIPIRYERTGRKGQQWWETHGP